MSRVVERERDVGVDGGPDLGVPVILVPGFGRASGIELVQRHLARAGFDRVVTARYSPRSTDVTEVAMHLSKLVDAVLRASGAQKSSEARVHLVGHNLGGIAIRYYVQVLGGADRVDTAITIGAPHTGQRRSQLDLGPGALQLVQGSNLVQLLEHSAAPSDVRWIAFHSGTDQLISPSSSATLTHPMLDATNIALDDERCLSVRLSHAAARAVANALISTPARH